jgi:SEC-C motif-containing protein
MPTTCPCGLPQPYDACCGRFHRGEAAPSAELLMRARYSAFALGDETYLLDSWHSSTRPKRLALDPAQRWVGLTVSTTTGGGLFDAEGTVAFEARYERGSRRSSVQENSRFSREDGAWRYLGPVPGA